MNPLSPSLPIAVIGAGPVGLAAAAHLLRRGLTPLVLEAGPAVAGNLESYRHVQLFSPWRYNIDRAAAALLAGSGWQAPDPDALPSAGQLIDAYLAPLAKHPALAPHLRLGHRVRAIARDGYDKAKSAGRDGAPFVLHIDSPDGPLQLRALAVVDAAGTWSHPNPLGASGLPARGEAEAAAHIAYGMPDILGRDARRYAGKRVLVVGAGHSAAGNLIALAELARRDPATSIVWALRRTALAHLFGGGSADGLPARGELGMRLQALQETGLLALHLDFHVAELRLVGTGLQVRGDGRDGAPAVIDKVDQIIGATGARPDLAMTRELRLRLDPALDCTEALAPLIDPNLHSCGTIRPHGHRELAHPEAGYYTVGAKSYGRAPNFLMLTGYEQVRSIAAALAGDLQAADSLRLELPETGVCSTVGMTGAQAGCCGGKAPAAVRACCVADADAQAAGKAGCGCGDLRPGA